MTNGFWFDKKQQSKRCELFFFWPNLPMWPELFHKQWDAMHITMRALPRGELSSAERTQAIDYLRSQMPLIPCGGCSLHAMMYFAQNPPDGTTGQSFYAWTVAFHNSVNERLSKRVYTLDEAEKELTERTTKEYEALTRDVQRQKLDHAKIKSLQEELNLFKSIPHARTNQGMLVYVIMSVVIACAVLFLTIIFFAMITHQLRSLQKFHFAAATQGV